MASSSLVVLFVALSTAVFAGRPAPSPANINQEIDKFVVGHNEILQQRKIESLTIPAGTTNGIEFSQGKQYYPDTMKRTGDGFALRESDDSVRYEYRIGFERLAFSFDQVKLGDAEVKNARLEVKGGNSIKFYFTVNGSGSNCKVTLDEYKYDKMEGVTVEGEGLGEEAKTSLVHSLLDHINSSLESKKVGVERHLQPICKTSSE